MLVGRAEMPQLIMPLLGIGGAGAVFFLRRSVTKRREKLRALLDRLTRHVTATARPALPDANSD